MTKTAPIKVRVGKPFAAAPKSPAKTAEFGPAAAKPAAPEASLVKPAESKTAPAASTQAAAAAPPVKAPESVLATPAATPAAQPAPAPVPVDSLPLPRPPEAATVATATVMSQALTMARAFGALQAHMLDHACAELEATLKEAQTLAQTRSASEAIALQAKAVRRSYESYAEHLRELARVANAALRKD